MDIIVFSSWITQVCYKYCKFTSKKEGKTYYIINQMIILYSKKIDSLIENTIHILLQYIAHLVYTNGVLLKK